MLAILLFSSGVQAQEEKETEPDIAAPDLFKDYKNPPADKYAEGLSAEETEPASNAASPPAAEREPEAEFFAPIKNEFKWRAIGKDVYEKDVKNFSGQKNFSQI